MFGSFLAGLFGGLIGSKTGIVGAIISLIILIALIIFVWTINSRLDRIINSIWPF